MLKQYSHCFGLAEEQLNTRMTCSGLTINLVSTVVVVDPGQAGEGEGVQVLLFYVLGSLGYCCSVGLLKSLECVVSPPPTCCNSLGGRNIHLRSVYIAVALFSCILRGVVPKNPHLTKLQWEFLAFPCIAI